MFYCNRYYQEDLKEILDINLPFENFRNKNILITGANGLIASCLVDTLVYLRENRDISFNIYILCRNKIKAENRFKSFLNKDFFKINYIFTSEPSAKDERRMSEQQPTFLSSPSLLKICVFCSRKPLKLIIFQ